MRPKSDGGSMFFCKQTTLVDYFHEQSQTNSWIEIFEKNFFHCNGYHS